MKKSFAPSSRAIFPNTPRRAAAGVLAAVFLVSLALGIDLAWENSRRDHPVAAPEEPDPPAVAPSTKVPPPPLLLLQPGSRGGPFKLVKEASQDFTGEQLDTTKWGVYNSAGNAGVGWRRPSAITVGNGALHITARGDVSGGLAQSHNQLYGRWIVRAKMDKGNGYGPAILLWPNSGNWPEDGEIDFAEIPRGDRSEVIMTAHWGKENSQDSEGVQGDFSQWHTFAVDWLPDRLVFYVDGVEEFRLTDPAAIPRTPMHLAIQNDVGACDSWIGCTDKSTPAEVTLSVSSVRVYSVPESQFFPLQPE
jgi:beta-glucanase (GH16 family)